MSSAYMVKRDLELDAEEYRTVYHYPILLRF